jgi:hypothetical protein
MSQSQNHNSNNGGLSKKPENKKKKEYWPAETEDAVRRYLEIDYSYYLNKKEKYIESCEKKGKELDDDFILLMDAQLDYTSRKDVMLKKDEIFRKEIKKPLWRLVENIIFNFGLFRSDVDVKTLHNDCVGFVYSKFANFDPEKGTKSFSFYGTIAKHYLMNGKKDFDKLTQVNLEYESFRDEADSKEITFIDEENENEKSHKFFKTVIEELEKEISKKNISKNDEKVGDAIIQIFKTHKQLNVYQKNQLYQLLKEQTELDTKDITYSLSRFKVFYKLLKQDFIKKENETGS